MKDIKGYEGLYAITSCGKVWSYRSQKFLKPSIAGHGYCSVSLCNNGKQKTFKIHRLVAEAYISNPNDLLEINHKDECKEHNYINNLEWCDRSHNVNYGSRTNKAVKARFGHGLKIYCKELNRIFESQTAAAKELGLWQGNITKVCTGKAKTTGGYHFEFLKNENSDENFILTNQ